ncbi:MAG: hypothetical protein AAFN77_01900 [Planctomycetota bacterium]
MSPTDIRPEFWLSSQRLVRLTIGPATCSWWLCGVAMLLMLPSISNAGVWDDDAIDRESLKFHDEIRLRSGQVLQGTLIGQKTIDGKKIIEFESLDGDQLTIAISRIVDQKGVRPINAPAKRYNSMLDQLEDTAKWHHDMVLWCEEQDRGSVMFKDQIRFHRMRIMALDPNDEKVRRQLNYKFVEGQGKWVLEEQYWKSIGYVGSGSNWIPTMQKDLDNRSSTIRKTTPPSIAAYNAWERRFRNMSLQQAQGQLLQMTDEILIAKLIERLPKEKNSQKVAMYIEAFGKIPSPNSARGLIFCFMELGNDRALDLLQQEGFNRSSVSAELVNYLGNPNNAVINRAAFAIGELNTTNSILALADALITEHTVRPAGDPGRINTTFGNNGVSGMQFGGGNGPTKMMFKNDDVLNALRKISEEDFGDLNYDKGVWQRWYIANYTHRNLKARR